MRGIVMMVGVRGRNVRIGPALRQWALGRGRCSAGSVSPEAYFKRQSLLNLTRPSEMPALFRRYGLNIRMVLSPK